MQRNHKVPILKHRRSPIIDKTMKEKKIAFSGTSGSGKTTLVTKMAELNPNLTHISGSAGDLKQEGDKMILDEVMGYPGGGHSGVIRFSALNPEYGIMNQQMLQMRRSEVIFQNTNFLTDRSPADNITYFVNQCGFHPMVTDAMVEEFIKNCQKAWDELTHVVFVRAVQPKEVERNFSRVANRYYQKAIDCQFAHWIDYLDKNSMGGPELMVVDYWDLDRRIQEVNEFINS